MHVITLSTDHGPKIHQAYIHGKFAVHLSHTSNIEGMAPNQTWTISHVASGLSITTMQGRPKARALARQLDAAVAADITAADITARNNAWRAFVAIVRPIVKGN